MCVGVLKQKVIRINPSFKANTYRYAVCQLYPIISKSFTWIKYFYRLGFTVVCFKGFVFKKRISSNYISFSCLIAVQPFSLLEFVDCQLVHTCSISMKMESFKFVFFLAVGMTLCYAKVSAGTDANNITPSEKAVNSTTPAEKQQYVAVQSSLFPTDLTWKTGFGQALIFVGAAAFSFVLVGGLTLLFAPVFGYKVCSILGNCGEQVATTYSATQPNSYTDAYGTPYYGAPYTTFQKRSVEYIKPAEYIKPILETLAKAYEKSS